ncbi:hypothetical protein EVAR_81922_1 [Eumeta japonica]|uniref:Uncharacterized protein n=1 Tax=Eumeta variegata TaxID=151549 RepID=A0A4C1UYJ1_EUMVA|nr:hypothetical protein EVAR_81922_1 [Eumeta japonica]
MRYYERRSRDNRSRRIRPSYRAALFTLRRVCMDASLILYSSSTFLIYTYQLSLYVGNPTNLVTLFLNEKKKTETREKQEEGVQRRV